MEACEQATIEIEDAFNVVMEFTSELLEVLTVAGSDTEELIKTKDVLLKIKEVFNIYLVIVI